MTIDEIQNKINNGKTITLDHKDYNVMYLRKHIINSCVGYNNDHIIVTPKNIN